MPGPRSLRGAGLLLPVPALLLLLVFEAHLRARHEARRQELRARFPARDLCTQKSEDPALVYELAPGRCGANSHGFLDEEHGFDKPPGTRRIVVVGDSVAQGSGLPLEESFPKLLEAMLNEGEGARYEVIVLACPGYSTSQELRLLETQAYRYHPDLVLWSYVLNDPADPIFHNPSGELGFYYHEPRVHTWEWLEEKLFFLRERWRAAGCRQEYHAVLHCAYRRKIESDIAQVGSLSREKGVPGWFVIHPVFEQGVSFREYSLAWIHEDLARAARGAGLTVIDLLEAYRPYDPEDLKQPDPPGWHDPWHPNARGHRIAAEYLGARLVAEGLTRR